MIADPEYLVDLINSAKQHHVDYHFVVLAL